MLLELKRWHWFDSNFLLYCFEEEKKKIPENPEIVLESDKVLLLLSIPQSIKTRSIDYNGNGISVQRSMLQ